MCLIVELAMLGAGLYALIAGKINLGGSLRFEGTPARIIGVFLVAPLPLAFAGGLVFGFMIGIGLLPASLQNYFFFIDLLVVLVGLGGALIYALVNKPGEEPLPPG